jgi:signal transduction histidine kinase
MSPPEVESHLDVILQQSKRMNSIIDELLLLARIRVVEDLEIEPLDMRAIVAAVLERIAAEMQSQNVALLAPESWPLVLGYTPWVEGVWYNYISNGLKYGGDPPQVVLGCDSAGRGMAHFWIRDNGPGLTPAEIEKLFEPFPKLERSRKKGHGLGLVIVRRIVERLGGQAWVESQPGEGSTFYFSLPRA